MSALSWLLRRTRTPEKIRPSGSSSRAPSSRMYR
nr:MAG TPA: hypothetical protein [Caudoviricetes sp.]